MKLSGTMMWRIVVGLLLVLHLSAYIPWQPSLDYPELDSSWMMGLHWAWLHGLAFGRDVIFTFGPWGFIFYGYHPNTFIFTVLGWTLCGVALFAAMVRIAEQINPRRWIQALWIALMICLTGSTFDLQDVRTLEICLAMLVLHFYVDDRPLAWNKVLLAVAMGLISLGKFSMGTTAVGVMAAISLDEIVRGRVPKLLGIYVMTVIVLWLAAGQSPLNFFRWLYYSLILASGFSSSVSTSPPSELMDVILFLLCGAGVITLAVLVYYFLRKSDDRALRITRISIVAMAFAGLFLLLFKAGYVRHDHHEVVATLSVLLLASMLAAANWGRLRAHRLIVPMCVILLLCAGTALMGINRYFSNSLVGTVTDTFGLFPSRIASAGKWFAGRSGLRERFETYLQTCRDTRDLPALTGTVDYYPYASRVVMAYGMDYHPRPVMQSYPAFTTQLAELNAEFLRSSKAPDNILFEVGGIDQRYPPEEDGLSWPEVLTRYDLTDVSKSVLVFRKAANPRPYKFENLQTTAGTLGDWVAVPASVDPVWIKISLHSTLRGKLTRAVYKSPIVMLNMKLASGIVMSTRLIPDIAGSGFLLSPLTVDRMSAAMLLSKDWRVQLGGAMVTQIQIVPAPGEDLSHAFQAQYDVSFSSLSFPRQDLSLVPGFNDYIRFRMFAQSARLVSSTASPQIVNGDQLRFVLLAPPVSRLLVDLPPGTTKLRLSFGLLRNSYQGRAKSDGVEFNVIGASPNDRNELILNSIWSRTLNPISVAGDRGLQVVEIPLPGPVPEKVILETLPGDNDVADDSYWADVDFR